MKRLNGWILPADRTTSMMFISMICIGSFFCKVMYNYLLSTLAALLYLTSVITVLVNITRYCTQGHHALVKLIIRGIVYVFIPFCIFQATLVLRDWLATGRYFDYQVERNSGWYVLTEIGWCFFTVIGCVISESVLWAFRPNSGKIAVKRLIGMMLVMVGCGDLVRNENGEVIEFTRFPETDADLEQLRDMPELESLFL